MKRRVTKWVAATLLHLAVVGMGIYLVFFFEGSTDVLLIAVVGVMLALPKLDRLLKERFFEVEADLSKRTLRDFRETVIDAVFIRLLQEKGLPVSGADERAGLARWKHLRAIAGSVDVTLAIARGDYTLVSDAEFNQKVGAQ